MAHTISGIILFVVGFLTIFGIGAMFRILCVGQKQVDREAKKFLRQVKDFFTPNTILMLRKLEK